MKPWAVWRLDGPDGRQIECIAEADTREELERFTRFQRRPRTNEASIIFSGSGRSFQSTVRSLFFDRSWYGRVLVERVEGFAAKREWRRGYEEINQFERLLVEDGIPSSENLPAHFCKRANAPVQGPGEKSAQAVEALLRGLPQRRAMGGLRSRDRRYDGTNIDQMGALVSGADK